MLNAHAARAPAVIGARLAYGLPYAWSRMEVVKSGRLLAYRSARIWPKTGAGVNIRIEQGQAIEAGGLEHAPWPLASARVSAAEETLTRAAGLPGPEGPPLAHYSRGVRVRIARPKLCCRRRYFASRGWVSDQ